jgi:hypothetical protein
MVNSATPTLDASAPAPQGSSTLLSLAAQDANPEASRKPSANVEL